MKPLFLFCLLSVFLSHASFAQERLTIFVTDRLDEPLPYPEIKVVGKLHKVGTKEGILHIDKNMLNVGDTVLVRYMGYEPDTAVLNNELLAGGNVDVVMDEKLYLLATLVVNKNDFDGEALFKKKKQKLLLPYFNKYQFTVDYEFTTPGYYLLTGNVRCRFNKAHVNIDSASIVLPDTTIRNTLIKGIKRANEINYLVADIFCYSKHRKRFYCEYKGTENNLEQWEFIMRPQKNNLWNLGEEDELKCLVALNEHGVIAYIVTQLTAHSETAQSYLLQTKYALFHRKLVASEMILKVLPNAVNQETPEFVLKLVYSGFEQL